MSESVKAAEKTYKKIKCCQAEIKILGETETEMERKEILIKKIKYYNAKFEILIKSNKNKRENKGDKAEVLLVLKLYHLNELEKFDKLIEIFGEEASEGLSTTEEISIRLHLDLTSVWLIMESVVSPRKRRRLLKRKMT